MTLASTLTRLASPSILITVPFLALTACNAKGGGHGDPGDIPTPSGHPRLWLTAEDVPRLRGWAVDSNPIWKNGLLAAATAAKAEMDSGDVPSKDSGSQTESVFNTESYAELFAFMSLVHPDEAARTDYAKRARTLLMYVIDKAAAGRDDDQPFRMGKFSVDDRSRWTGEAFGLTVDWIYPFLTADDKATIRKVFLRWCSENIGEIAYANVEPIGVINDPQLTENERQVRWANNNYYNAHMRNLGLMSLSLDAADDPDGSLRQYIWSATGAYLYVLQETWSTVSAGGLLAEGFEYSPQSLAYQTQFLWALRTSGQDDPSVYGPQVAWTQPFFDDVLPAFLHSLSPATIVQDDWVGPVYLPAWYGDAQDYRAPDMIAAFAPLALRARDEGDTTTLQAYRWAQIHTPPGGQAKLASRARGHLQGILYFLLFDPTAAVPGDPRGSLELTWMAEGIGRLLARTGWGDDASLFVFSCGWKGIDHQTADGLNFELYRGGEWLTKHRIGYEMDYGLVDNHNGLAIQNDQPSHSEQGDYRRDMWQRGSQWLYVETGPGTIPRWSAGPGYVYALGDATDMYNSDYEGVDDVVHASRSIVWLKPDHVVLYDRAATATAGRFKKLWFQLPAAATVSGKVASVNTPGGQRLFVTSLLPASAAISSALNPEESEAPANGETMTHRLLVDAGTPSSTRFLHVVQGADAGATVDAATLVQSTAGTSYAGATVASTTVMFPVDLTAAFSGVTYTTTAGTRQLVTGLSPGATYSVTSTASGADCTVQIATSGSGTAITADSGGVLVIPP